MTICVTADELKIQFKKKTQTHSGKETETRFTRESYRLIVTQS